MPRAAGGSDNVGGADPAERPVKRFAGDFRYTLVMGWGGVATTRYGWAESTGIAG